MKITKKTLLNLRIQKVIFVFLLLCISALIAWLSQQHRFQFDWTQSQRNTLSQSSITLLKKLEAPVTVNVYAQDEPTVRAAIQEILNRYQRETKQFRYKIINPDLDIEQARLDEVSEYGQLVIKHHGKKETLSTLSEQAISSAIQRLAQHKQRKLVFLSGHGERDPASSNNTGYSQLVSQLKSKGFTNYRHNLLESPIPDDTDVLIIAAPDKMVLPGELDAIKAYIQKGGNLLWMVDPDNSSDNLHGLSDLAILLGANFLNGMIVDNNVDLRKTLRIEHPAMIPVLDYQSHQITQSLDYNTLFPLSRGIIINENDDWGQTVIAQSMARSWSETGDLNAGIVFNTEDGDIAGPVPVVIALERTLASTTAEIIKASQRIVVSGDSDFLANSYIGIGANLLLGTNILSWLAGDDDLISVDIKNAPDTQLRLNDIQTLVISLGFLIILPATLFITGMIIWFRRRKR